MERKVHSTEWEGLWASDDAALAASLGAQALTLALPPLRTLLNLTPLTLLDAAVAAGCIAAPFVINESPKRLSTSKHAAVTESPGPRLSARPVP